MRFRFTRGAASAPSSAALSSLFFFRLYGNLGVFVVIALGMTVVVLVIGGWGPKTNRLRLEEIAQ